MISFGFYNGCENFSFAWKSKVLIEMTKEKCAIVAPCTYTLKNLYWCQLSSNLNMIRCVLAGSRFTDHKCKYVASQSRTFLFLLSCHPDDTTSSYDKTCAGVWHCFINWNFLMKTSIILFRNENLLFCKVYWSVNKTRS